MATRIVITPQGSPGCYRATLDGVGLIASSKTPFLDSARVLQARGITGPLEMWDAQRPYPRMVGDIAHAAKLAIVESDRDGLVVRPYKAFPTAAGPRQEAIAPPELG